MFTIVLALLECFALSLINRGSALLVSDVIAIPMVLLLSFAVLADISKNNKLRLYSSSLYIGFLMRLFFLFFDIYASNIFTLPNSGADSDMFFWSAISYATSGYNRRGLYPQIIGSLYKIIGISRIYAQFLSMFCSIVALIFLAYSLSELDISDESRKRTFKITCLLPNFAILSSLFLREAVITMFLSMSIYEFVRWISTKSGVHYFMAAVLVLPAAAFHSGVIAVLVGYIVIRLVYDNRKERISFSPQNLIPVLILVLVAGWFLSRYSNTFLNRFQSVESIEDIASVNTEGGSSYARFVGNSSNPVSMVVFTIPRLLYFLFSPFPWQWRSIADLIGFFFSGLFYLIIVKDTITVLRHNRSSNTAILSALFVVALAAVFVFAWGTSNTGTAVRHRDKMVTLFTVIWALSRDEKYGLKNVRAES